MATSKPTNREVAENGEYVTDYACDLNSDGELESNGGVEYVYFYKGKHYAVVCGWTDELYFPDKPASETDYGVEE